MPQRGLRAACGRPTSRCWCAPAARRARCGASCSAAGVASVYLSDQDSVFASAEARDLLHWLRAVAQPLDARLVRAALGHPHRSACRSPNWRGWPSDDEAFDARSEQLARLHAVWQSQGVLTMLRPLHLHDCRTLPAALAAAERRRSTASAG